MLLRQSGKSLLKYPNAMMVRKNLTKTSIVVIGNTSTIEPHEPTIARVMPMNNETLDKLLGSRTEHKEAKAAYSDSTAKRHARLGALSRSTKNVAWGLFTHTIQFAFGHGGDRSSYVQAKGSPVRRGGKVELNWRGKMRIEFPPLPRILRFTKLWKPPKSPPNICTRKWSIRPTPGRAGSWAWP